MNDKLIQANGVDLCVETLGNPGDPAILLVHGAAASMLWWEDEFCERLAAGPRFVIRYDHRDTGRSVSYEPGAPPYTIRDLVADAVGILDALGLAGVHWVGMSMGGVIAQLAALDFPDRVTSLTLIGTTPAERRSDDADLPPMPEEARARFRAVGEPDWSDREAVIDHIVALERACASESRGFDDAGMRALATRAVDRTVSIESSMTNHFVMDGGERWRHRLGEIDAPTLVMHGTEDPVLPFGHAVALQKDIPAAKLIALEDTGHEVPRAVWDVVVAAILEQTSPR
jgi:pimeloyl-ACP methyl ester carboxylesterase